MQLYRFSPITTEEQLDEAIQYLHIRARELCVKAVGLELPVAENIGIFCHYSDEYTYLSGVRESLTNPLIHFNNKYFGLFQPIIIDNATYKYLYIRQPDPYRGQVGDIDFVMPKYDFDQLKRAIQNDPNQYPYARLFPRTDIDMIELYHPDIDVLCYIVVGKMSEKLTQS